MRDVPVPVRLGLVETQAAKHPVRLGLVETQAAKHYARFGYYPEAYMVMVRMYCGGIVPARVNDLAARIREARPWDVATNPHPGMTRVWLGPHSFLVSTKELLP